MRIMTCGLQMRHGADHCCDLNIDLDRTGGAVPDVIQINGMVFKFDTISDAGQPLFTKAGVVYHYSEADEPPSLECAFPAHCG